MFVFSQRHPERRYERMSIMLIVGVELILIEAGIGQSSMYVELAPLTGLGLALTWIYALSPLLKFTLKKTIPPE